MLLPLFPLPSVLLPGMRVPLHIFEQRYRRMLHDVLAGDRSFGFVYRDPDIAEEDLPSGTALCRAVIDDVEQLGGGKANIAVQGSDRFTFVRFEQAGTPYLVGEVAPLADATEPAAGTTALASRLQEVFRDAALPAQWQRVMVHERAKSNGHGHAGVA